MTFSPGDRVHLPGVGTGVVKETRSGGRYAIDIKGRTVVASGADLERAGDTRTRRSATPCHLPGNPAAARSAKPAPSLDLHGHTVAEALAAVEAFVSDAIVDGHHEVRIVHGRGGGRIRAAVHRCLEELPAVDRFRVDPRNAGVTIVTFR